MVATGVTVSIPTWILLAAAGLCLLAGVVIYRMARQR